MASQDNTKQQSDKGHQTVGTKFGVGMAIPVKDGKPIISTGKHESLGIHEPDVLMYAVMSNPVKDKSDSGLALGYVHTDGLNSSSAPFAIKSTDTAKVTGSKTLLTEITAVSSENHKNAHTGPEPSC